MSHHSPGAVDSAAGRVTAPVAVALPPRPPIATAVLMLVGGIAGAAQLITPWLSYGTESTSGWAQYFSVAHHGTVEIVAAYLIVAVALAGAVMIVSAVGLFGRRPDYRTPLAAGAVATAVALLAGLWWLATPVTPSAHLFTLGWYLFLLAGPAGALAFASRHLSPARLLVLIGGISAALQIILPWFSSSKRSVSGWQQYYGTAHKGAVEVIAAYAIPIGAAVGVILIAAALVPALQRAALPATVVLLACAAFWLAFAATSGVPSFGYFLFLISGAFALAGALQLRGRIGAPALTTILAGLIGLAQLALPWFDDETGFGFYYRTAHSGIMNTIAAYGVLLAAIAAAVLLAAGIVMAASPDSPARRRSAARIGRIAAIAILIVIGYWLLLGPHPVAAAIASGGFGWYLLIGAGAAGLTGTAIPLARTEISFDKASFMALFLGLPLAIFLLFVVSPFIQAVYYSMTDWKGFSAEMNFTGLDNYIKLFHDDKFRQALFNNIKLGIVVPLVTIILALAVASMVTVGGPSRGPVRGLGASSFYRVVSFFPYTVPAIVIGLIWAQVYDPARGILNKVLTSLGLDFFTNFAWLGERSTAMGASMFVIIWSFVGFYAVLFIASIKGISAEVYEAAKLDGAGRFRTAISVTIPLIRDTIQTAYIYLGIAALDAFVYMMALNPFGGPDNTTLVMSQDLYNTAFRKGQFGYATSMGVILAIVTLLFATLVFAVNRYTGGGDRGGKKLRRDPKATLAPAEMEVVA